MLSPELKELVSIQKKKVKRDSVLKDKVIDNVKTKFMNYGKLGHTNCVIKVPAYIFGEKAYEHQDMYNYVYKKLKNDGYKVVALPDFKIYVSWDVKDLYSKK